jgi:hypothetical protein
MSKSVFVSLVILFVSLVSQGQQSAVFFVFDHPVRLDEFKSIMGQLPALEKVKSKVSVDLIKIPLEENPVFRFTDQSEFPSGFQSPLDCDVEPCKVIKQFMSYRSSTTNLLVMSSGALTCNPGGMVTLVGSLEQVNAKLKELIGSKSARKRNKEVIIFLSKEESRVKPTVEIVEGDLTVFEGESVSLSAKSDRRDAKFQWSPVKSSTSTLTFTPKETGFYRVVSQVGNCFSDPDSVLITVQPCVSKEKLRVLWEIDNSIYTRDPVDPNAHFVYRSSYAENNYVLICNSSCAFPSYSVTVRNAKRNTIVLEGNYRLGKELVGNTELNIPDGPYPDVFVFVLGGMERKFDFNYQDAFEIVVEGVDPKGGRSVNFKEYVYFSQCP